ncbi:MAG TPA: aminoglycoside phosphotransferase family protein [Polyangiaceae bacterium]|jgi:aminoglycoside phosphotransferase (APT) family kinase protein|nr:aminoglycoside phosphotransferase family protein [Polyangiaceae bacterium]
MTSIGAVEANALLSAAGFEVAINELRPDPREERTMFAMPGARAAWFASSEAGRVRLRHEARVLRLLARRCSFEVPRVLFESADAALQVRALVPGNSTPFEWYQEAQGSPAKAREFGASIGAILAEQHRRIEEGDVAGWSRRALLWPLSRSQVREALGRVVANSTLRARCDRVLAMKEEVHVVPTDCALVHGDLGFHNVVLDPKTFRVIGVYDYDGAAWADRHYDFRYLVFDLPGGALDQVLEGALAVYEPLVGVALSRARIHLYNAASAVGFLAFRDGHAPEENWCGRTLSEDVAWTEHALRRVGV